MQEKNITKSIIFSERLSQLIKESGMTQTQVAEKLGVSQASVNFWINGRNDPKGKELFAISKLFGCSIDWLLTGDEKKTEDSATQMWRDRALLAEQKLEIAKEALKGVLKKI